MFKNTDLFDVGIASSPASKAQTESRAVRSSRLMNSMTVEGENSVTAETSANLRVKVPIDESAKDNVKKRSSSNEKASERPAPEVIEESRQSLTKRASYQVISSNRNNSTTEDEDEIVSAPRVSATLQSHYAVPAPKPRVSRTSVIASKESSATSPAKGRARISQIVNNPESVKAPSTNFESFEEEILEDIQRFSTTGDGTSGPRPSNSKGLKPNIRESVLERSSANRKSAFDLDTELENAGPPILIDKRKSTVNPAFSKPEAESDE